MQIKLINVLFYTRKGLIKGVMRIFVFLFCTTLLSLTPRSIYSQNEKIVIGADQDVSVDAVFDMIKAQTDYIFIYHEDLFKGFPKVQLKKGTIKFNKLLKISVSNANVNVKFISSNTIIINKKNRPQKQQVTVSGIVTDQSGLSIPGATVLIKGSTKGTAANLDGYYQITVPDPAHVLVFSSLGFKSQEITVGRQTTINISLTENISALDEVTIRAGYYNTTQKEKTGSIGRIDAKTIEKQPVSNPLAAMQGYLPGVNIIQNTGAPGGDFKVEIRGRNFISGATDPLYIIDGVPYSSKSLEGDSSNTENIQPGALVSPLNLIAPSNIKSIEVLKDADATAIYGSRGANGVVLITTKKGRSGKMQIKVNLSTGLASVPRFVELLNTEQYLDIRFEALTNDGLTLETIPPHLIAFSVDLLEWDQKRYTDWQEVLIGGTAYRNTGELSFSGGNAQTQFLVSGDYQHQTTVYIGDSKYSKASVHSNITHQSVDERLHFNVGMNYAADNNQLPGVGFIRTAYGLSPNAPALYDGNGALSWEGWTRDFPNPLAQLESKSESRTNNFQLNSTLSYQLFDNLELKASLGYTDYRNEGHLTLPSSMLYPDPIITTEDFSNVQINKASRRSWILEPQMNWQKNCGRVSFNILMGATFQQDKSNQFRVFGLGFPSNSQILDLSVANETTIKSDDDLVYKYSAVFGRLNFKWADRYILNLTGRRDGSSRFGPGRQFGNFYALGGAWLFSKESFLKESDLLSFGKLRSSYGITGSDNVDDYAFYDTYESVTTNYDGPGLRTDHLFNPIFGWQTNKKFEVALELGFLQDRIFLTTAWYQNRSSNQLVDTPLPGTTGFSGVNANFDATVENTGLEIDFRSINVQNKFFEWTSTFNISVPRNKLVKFDGLETSTYAWQYIVGQPLSIRKLFHVTGVDPDTGLYQFEDYNNDGLITEGSTSPDRGWVEDTTPKFYGGLGNTVHYKNWTLDVFFQFKKHKISEFVNAGGGTPGRISNLPKAVLNRQWQQIGDEAVLQRYSIGTNPEVTAASRLFRGSNAIYTDGSFIRLRNIDLSYTLPKTSGMDVSIYLQGQNLLTLTKFKGPDPDHFFNTYLPALRQFTLGVQLGF